MRIFQYFPPTCLKTAALAALLVSATACNKDFLEKTPLDQTTEANFYRNEKDALAAVNAAYDVLQFEITGGGHFRWFFGDIVSDDATKGGSGDNDVVALGDIENFRAKATNELVTGEWAADYQGIYRANLVLKNVPAIVMDETLKARILGEAKFIRAWFYYNLVTIFGDVPLITSPLAPSEYNMPRTEKANVWAQIETDLKDAAGVLPLRSQYGIADIGRITKGTAEALLAKTYLWQSKWSDAQMMTNEIINSGEYFLVADYATIFTLAGEDGPESVFEIQYMPASNGDWGRAQEGTFTNVFQRARGQFGGFGFNIPTQNFVAEFEAGDPRLAATVFRVGDQMGDRGVFTKEATGSPYDFHPKKYFISQSEEAPTGDKNVNGPSNDRVIRYSDVLLMHAEASYRLGDETSARQAVNQVRARARGTAAVLPNVGAGVTGDALLQAIYHERRVELGMEGHRFFDLVRTGRAGAVMRALGYSYVDGIHELFPIPLTQIQATNNALIQNPGY